MADDLVIRMKIDNSDAMAKQRAVGAGFDQATAKADATAKKTSAAFGRSADAQVKAIDAVTKRWDLGTQAVDRFVGGLAAIGLQSLSIHGIATAFNAITRALADSNKQLDDYADDLFKVKDSLKELATLKGLSTASDDFIKQISTFSRATGLSITQTDEYQRQFLGSLAGGMQKGNIDQPTADQLMLEGGKVAARQTKDLSTRGDLLGILSQFRKYDQGKAGVSQALSDAEAIRIGLTEGRGDDAPLTKSLLHVSGSLAGEGKRIDSLPELAALIGVTSLSAGAGQADTRSEQLVRGLQGETPEQVKFLKEFAGIDEHDSLEKRLDKIVPQLRAMKAAGRDPQAFLTENKMNAEQVRALTEMEPNYELMKKRFAAARNAPSGEALMAESERQAMLDPTQRRRIADADLAAAKIARGSEREAIQPDVVTAKARLVDEKVDTSISGMLRRFAASAGSGFTTSGIDSLAQQRAIDELEAKTGVKPPMSFLGGYFSSFAGKDFGAGVESLTGSSQETLRLLRAILDAQQANNKILAGNKPQPPIPVVQPGGANAGRVR